MIHDDPQRIRRFREAGWWADRTIDDLVREAVAARADEPALVDPANRAELGLGAPRRRTYRELDEAVDRVASGLLGLGVGRDDIVMVQLPNVSELAIVLLAVMRIGAIVSPVPTQYRSHELRYLLELAEPRAFVTTDRFDGISHLSLVQGLRAAVPSLAAVIADTADPAALPHDVAPLASLLDTPCDRARLAAHRAAHPLSADDVVTVCWTSGTEAEPKGVPRSHNLWLSIALGTVDGAELGPGARLLCPFPLVNMSGIGGMLVPWLIAQGVLVLHQPLALPVFLQQIAAERIEYTLMPPVLLSMLLLRPQVLANADLGTVKRIGSGSAPLSPFMTTGWKEKHGIDIVNFFGSNEGIAMVSAPSDVPDAAERAALFPRYGRPGLGWRNRCNLGYATKLVDPATGREIDEPGVPGEMRIQGPTVFAGYFRRADLTERAFDAEGFFRTGDLFTIERGADGELSRYRFVGRLRDLIIRGGMKIAPEELELLLAEHPELADVAVVGYSEGALSEEHICVVAVPKPDAAPTLGSVVDFLKAKDIAPYKLPKRLWIVPALPRNPLGKVQKRDLRAQLNATLPPRADR